MTAFGKGLVLAIATALFSATHAGAEASGPKIDSSFTMKPFYEIGNAKGHYVAIFYAKVFESKGRLTVCGGYTGTGFDTVDARLFLRKGDIGFEGEQTPIVPTLTFFARLEDNPGASDKAVQFGQGRIYKKSYVYGNGLPTNCKRTRIKWSPDFQSRTLEIDVPKQRTVYKRIRL